MIDFIAHEVTNNESDHVQKNGRENDKAMKYNPTCSKMHNFLESLGFGKRKPK